ncbi:hypothetical protein ZWY2020_057212 [Hordeum vulgare]|nr:hypothetical protein ZWY2020_057212 [Hordeum vulgare]
MSGVVKLPPTNCNASQLHLATSPDGKRLKLLAIDGFMISVWVQLPTVLAAGSSGWALETVIDIEENLRSLYPSLRAGGGPDIQVQFKPSGKKSSDVVLLRMLLGRCARMNKPSNMPKLRHLDIRNMLIKTKGVVGIASECHDLKFIDLHGYWDVDDKLLQEKYLQLKTLGPCLATAMRTASGMSAPMTQMMTTSTDENN